MRHGEKNSKVGEGRCVYWPMLELPVIPLEFHFPFLDFDRVQFCDPFALRGSSTDPSVSELAVYFGASHVCLY